MTWNAPRPNIPYILPAAILTFDDEVQTLARNYWVAFIFDDTSAPNIQKWSNSGLQITLPKEPRAQDFFSLIGQGEQLDSTSLDDLLDIVSCILARHVASIPESERATIRENMRDLARAQGLSEDMITRIESTWVRGTQNVRSYIRRTTGRLIITTAEEESANSYPDKIASEVRRMFYRLFFKSGKDMIYERLQTFTMEDRERLIRGYMNNEAFTVYKDDREINVRDVDGETIASFVDISEENPIKEGILSKQFSVDKWNAQITEAPNESTRSNLQKAAVIALLHVLHDYPWMRDIKSAEAIIDAKVMSCIWKAIVGHIFLEKLGIQHKACLRPWHISLMVYLDGNEYLFDPGISPSCLLMNKGKINWPHNQYESTTLSRGNTPFTYQLWEVQEFIWAAFINNFIHDYIDSLYFRNQITTDYLLHFSTLPIGSYILMGALNQGFEQVHTSKAYFKKEASIFWDWSTWYLELARLSTTAWLYPEAYWHYTEAISRSSDDPFRQACKKMRKKCLKDAYEEFFQQAWSTEQPVSIDLLSRKMYLISGQKEKPTSREILEILRVWPTDPELWQVFWNDYFVESIRNLSGICNFLKDAEFEVGGPLDTLANRDIISVFFRGGSQEMLRIAQHVIETAERESAKKAE